MQIDFLKNFLHCLFQYTQHFFYLLAIDDTFREIQKEQGISEENIKWYVDAAGEWRNSEQAKAINDKKFFRGILIFLLVAAIEIIIFKIDKMKHE